MDWSGALWAVTSLKMRWFEWRVRQLPDELLVSHLNCQRVESLRTPPSLSTEEDTIKASADNTWQAVTPLCLHSSSHFSCVKNCSDWSVRDGSGLHAFAILLLFHKQAKSFTSKLWMHVLKTNHAHHFSKAGNTFSDFWVDLSHDAGSHEMVRDKDTSLVTVHSGLW